MRRASSLHDEPAVGPPPLSARAVLAGAAALVAVLVVVVLSVVHLPGPLDETTLADQRNGLLKGGPTLPGSVAGVAFGGTPVVLLFVRALPEPNKVREFAAGLPDGVRLRVVSQAPTTSTGSTASTGSTGSVAGVPVTPDPDRSLARAVELPEPNDGGPGVGYAVVDPDRVVQYSTLDPSWPTNAFEAATIARASS